MERPTRHHLLFEGTMWNAREETRRLRQMGGNIVRLAQSPHTGLHDAITCVPTPNVYMARYMLSNYEPTGDVFTNIDGLCFAVEGAGRNKRANQLDRSLGDLIVASLQEQKPFIREGLYVHKQR